MNLSSLTALSPLDGRYAGRVAALRPLLSEFGLMHRRVQVEVEWFIALSDAGFKEFRPLSEAARGLLRGLVLRFSEADAQAIKDALTAVQAALAAPPQARLQTQPPLLFASAQAGDHAYLEAVGLINEGRYEQAIASLERARASFGGHPDILTYLGFANRKLHRFGVAESYYRAALAVAPEHKGATEYYGELMVERGNIAGARAMLARLDSLCTFGCAEADELRRWIEAGRSPAS